MDGGLSGNESLSQEQKKNPGLRDFRAATASCTALDVSPNRRIVYKTGKGALRNTRPLMPNPPTRCCLRTRGRKVNEAARVPGASFPGKRSLHLRRAPPTARCKQRPEAADRDSEQSGCPRESLVGGGTSGDSDEPPAVCR